MNLKINKYKILIIHNLLLKLTLFFIFFRFYCDFCSKTNKYNSFHEYLFQ